MFEIKIDPVEIIGLYLIGLIFIVLIQCISFFIFQRLFFKNIQYNNESINFGFSILLFISVWAVFNTQFKTYLIIPLLGIIMTFIYGIVNNFPKTKINLKSFNSFYNSLILLLISFTVLFLIQTLKVTDVSNFTARALHPDAAYSAGISDFLVKYGKETLILDPNANYSWQPYHYFEMHFSALISKIIGISSMKILYLVVFPILSAISILSLWEFSKTKNIDVPFWIIVVLYLVITDCGHFINQFLPSEILPDVSFINKVGTKLAIMPFIVIQTLRFLQIFTNQEFIKTSERYLNSALLLMCGFLYPTVLPLLSFVILVTNFTVSINKKFKYLFYALFGVIVLLLFLNLKSFKQLVFITHPIQYVVSFLPILLLVLFVFNWKSFIQKIKSDHFEFQLIAYPIVFLFFLKAAEVSQLYNNPDSGQMYGNFMDTFILIIVFYIILDILSNQLKTQKKRIFIFLGILGLNFLINQKYLFMSFPMKLVSLDPMLELPNNKLITWERSKVDFEKNTSSWLIHFDIPLSNTRWTQNNYFPLLKTLPEVKQITKITQRYAFEGVVKKASNFENDYFNHLNSIDLYNLTITSSK